MIIELSKEIKEIENEMQWIINSSTVLDHMFSLLKTVKCIGDQAALFLLVYTGALPILNRLRTSLRGTTCVSHLTNKKMKTLLDMCAKLIICYN